MYMSYDLSHYLDGDISRSTSFTVSDDDAINCAHMLAAGFNTISRKMMGDFVLAVVDTKARTVQYDGKIEKIDRPDPKHEDLESLALETVPIGPECFASTSGSLICWRGRNYIPQDEYEAHMRARNVEISELVQALANRAVEVEELRQTLVELAPARNAANESARAEMISFVKRAHAKKVKLQTTVPDGDGRPELDDRWRGMLDVLAKFLVVTGEADADEGHAVARRLCGIQDE